MRRKKIKLIINRDMIRQLTSTELTGAVGGISLLGTICQTCRASCPLTQCPVDGC